MQSYSASNNNIDQLVHLQAPVVSDATRNGPRAVAASRAATNAMATGFHQRLSMPSSSLALSAQRTFVRSTLLGTRPGAHWRFD